MPYMAEEPIRVYMKNDPYFQGWLFLSVHYFAGIKFNGLFLLPYSVDMRDPRDMSQRRVVHFADNVPDIMLPHNYDIPGIAPPADQTPLVIEIPPVAAISSNDGTLLAIAAPPLDDDSADDNQFDAGFSDPESDVVVDEPIIEPAAVADFDLLFDQPRGEVPADVDLNISFEIPEDIDELLHVMDDYDFQDLDFDAALI